MDWSFLLEFVPIEAAVQFAIGLFGVVVGMLGTLIFGRRYKERIARIEGKMEHPPINQTFIYGPGQAQVQAQEPTAESSRSINGVTAEYSDSLNVALIGTKAGAARVRFDDVQHTIGDIHRMLSKNGILAALDPDDALD